MKTLIWLALSLLTFNSNAALVNIDWKTTGDNLITRDTETGLEWLALNQTAEVSYTSISYQSEEGGAFEGWAYASREQISSFFDAAGGVAPYNGWSTLNDGVVDNLVQYWNGGSLGIKYILTGDLYNEAQIWFSRIQGNAYLHEGEDLMFLDAGSVNFGTSSDQYVSALVRVSAVPLPATVWLFGSGLIGLFGLAKYKARYLIL